MLNKEVIKEFINQKVEEVGLKQIPIVFDGRMNHKIGGFVFKSKYNEYVAPHKFRFNPQLLECSLEDVKQVCLHEIAHYIHREREHARGELFKDVNTHNNEFKEICKEIGCVEDGAHSQCVHLKYKYDIYCSKCGKITYSTNHKGEYYNLTSGGYQSTCCKARVVRKEDL